MNSFSLRKCAAATLLVIAASGSFTGGALAYEEPSPRIVVTGEGSSSLAPDMAVVSLTVAREAETARAALDENTSAMGKVMAAMRKAGIAERDLQTASFAIQPRYVYPSRNSSGEEKPPRIVGYTVSNSLTVRVRDIARVGTILDTAVSLGVNEGGNILFTNDDPSAAITEARVQAMRDALAKAKTLAETAGVRTGDLLEISEQSYRPRPMPMMRAEMAMDSRGASPVPVASGENTYSVTVNVTVAIEQ
tara:strand:- start:58900 stop:59646 length:747 start_codon:yes stop_codon:yes gene_type:complete